MLTGREIDLLNGFLSQNKDLIECETDIPDNECDILGYLTHSLLMKEYENFHILKLMTVSDSLYDTYIMIVEVIYSIARGKYPARYSEPQIFGLKKLNRNYGWIFVRPETFEDKLSGLFIKSEIDFPDFPKFSFRYYCLADNDLNAKSFATPDRLQWIEKQNEILIEVNKDVLLSKFSRIITYEDCESMVKFIKNI